MKGKLEAEVVSKAAFYYDLRIEGYGKDEYDIDVDGHYVGYSHWYIRWYPAGVKDVKSKEGYCSFILERETDENEGKIEDLTIICSYFLMRDGKTIDKGERFCTFEGDSYHIFDMVKIDMLQSGTISLKVEISLAKYSPGEARFRMIKKIVASLKKDICLLSGETSIKANSAVLSTASPVFKAELNSEHKWLESQDKSIDLGKDFENYLKEFVDFLEGKNIYLDIRNKDHSEKFNALITLGDIYKIDCLLEHILNELTASPCEKDILNRLLILNRFKHIKEFNKKAKFLVLWGYKNLEQDEFMELTSKVFLSHPDL